MQSAIGRRERLEGPLSGRLAGPAGRLSDEAHDRLCSAHETIAAGPGLRIEAVTPILVSAPVGDHGLGWSGGVLRGVTAGLVRVDAGDGLYGLGETYSGMFVPEVVRAMVGHLGASIVGQDARDLPKLWDALYASNLYWGRLGLSVCVISAIEMAVWDLLGKALDMPVVDLLGGPVRERIPIYASGGMETSDDALSAEQERYVEQGFIASKIRTGIDADRDEHIVAVAHAALAGRAHLAVDAVQGSNPNPWTPEEAIAVATQLEQYDLLWLEEPCAANDIDGYRTCRRQIGIPIAGGETLTTARQFADFLSAAAVDVAQPDVAHIGGVVEAMIATGVAHHLGIPVAMHVWGSGVCVMANYHVGFASGACEWLEYPTIGNPLVDELMAEPLELADGLVSAPRAPGLGVRLDAELEAAYPYDGELTYRFQERRGGAA